LPPTWKTLPVIPVAPVPTVRVVVLALCVVPTAFAIETSESIPDKQLGEATATRHRAALPLRVDAAARLT